MKETPEYVLDKNVNFPEKNAPKLQKISITAFVFSLLIVLTGLIYWFSINKNKYVLNNNTINTDSIIQKNPTESPKQNEDKLFVKSDVCKISFSIPKTWLQNEFKEEDDTYNYGCRFSYLSQRKVDNPEAGNFLIYTAQSDSLETLVGLSLATGNKESINIKGADSAVRITTTQSLQNKKLKNAVITVLITKEKSNFIVVFADIDSKSSELFNEVVNSINLLGSDEDYKRGFYAYSMLKKWHDSKVISDLQTIKYALAQYYKDMGNYYPDSLEKLKERGYIKVSYSFVNPITKQVYEYKVGQKFDSYKIYATDSAGMDISISTQ